MIFELHEWTNPKQVYLVFPDSYLAWEAYKLMAFAFPNQEIWTCCFGGYDNALSVVTPSEEELNDDPNPQ